jgi:hypothetical protein
MENEYKILNQITPQIKNPYRIIDGYFDGIANGVFLRIASKKITKQLPEDYFETLSSQIFNKINLTLEIPPSIFFSLKIIKKLLNKFTIILSYSLSIYLPRF